MTNRPFAQQLLDGIEERNDVIARQAERIEALEKALTSIANYQNGLNPIGDLITCEEIAEQALREQA